MFLSADTIDDLLRHSHEAIIANGIKGRSSRGENLALPGVLLELTNPRARLSRTESRGKIISCIGELVWILSGSDSLHAIAPYISQYVDESEDGMTIRGAYGPRIFSRQGLNQFERTIQVLQKRPNSRRAVIQILDGNDLSSDRIEIPCTLQLQFRILENRLNLFVSMRSNDAFLGLTHDVFVFTMLQELMACRLAVGLGIYKHFAGDLHIYTKDVEKVQRFLSEGWMSRLSPMPMMPADGLDDSVKILVQSEEFIRTHFEIPKLPSELDSYWINLIGFIGLHFANRNRNNELKLNCKAMVSNPVYHVYLYDRDLNE